MTEDVLLLFLSELLYAALKGGFILGVGWLLTLLMWQAVRWWNERVIGLWWDED